MNKKIFIRIILILAIIGVLIYAFLPKSKSGKAGGRVKTVPSVDAMIVKPSTLSNEISIFGTLLAVDEVEIKNEISGRIVELHLPEGGTVGKGTRLVKLFDGDLQAELKKLKSELAVKEQILKRRAELLKVNGVSRNDYEQSELDVASLKASIDVQLAAIRKTEVLAPFSGIIGLRRVSNGAVIPANTNLATLRSAGSLKLDFAVPERYSNKVRPGQSVSFYLNNAPERVYSAKVFATERGIDNASRNLKVRAMVSGTASELLPGAYATVKLNLGENYDALMVPTKAIIPDEIGKSLIIARNGRVYLKRVKTGLRTEAEIEIVRGLAAGDTVITNGLMFLKPGNVLKYNKIAK